MTGVLFLLALLTGPLPLGLAVLLRIDSAHHRSPIARWLLAILVIWTALQASVALALGTLGELRPMAVLAAEVTLFFTGLVAIRNRSNSSWGRRWDELLELADRPTLTEAILFVTFLVVSLYMLFAVAAAPITDYDSLAYHLPIIARWSQKHHFWKFEFLQPLRFPFDWEALCTLFVMPFHEDFLMDLPNWIAWNVLGLSIYLASREIGAPRSDAMVAALLTLAMSLVREQVTTAHVDLPLAAFFAAGVYFAYARARSCDGLDTLIFLLALGLMAGIKSSGVAYTPLLLFVFVALRRQGRHSDAATVMADWRKLRSVPAGPLWIAAILLPGGFWYAKNLMEVGNPLGVVQVNLAGTTLFRGPISSDFLRVRTLFHAFDLTSVTHWKVFLSAVLGGLGPPVMLLGFSAGLTLARWVKSRIETETCSLILLAGLAVATALIYWTTPFSASNTGRQLADRYFLQQALRYAFPFLAVLAVFSSIGMGFLGGFRSLVVVAVLLLALHGMGLKVGIAGLFLLALGWGVVRWIVRPRNFRDGRFPSVSFVLAVGTIVLFGVFAVTVVSVNWWKIGKAHCPAVDQLISDAMRPPLHLIVY